MRPTALSWPQGIALLLRALEHPELIYLDLGDQKQTMTSSWKKEHNKLSYLQLRITFTGISLLMSFVGGLHTLQPLQTATNNIDNGSIRDGMKYGDGVG